MQYEVRALDPSQQIHTLMLEALDPADAEQKVRARSMAPLSVVARGGLFARQPPQFSVLLLAQELHALLSAGLSVIETLETLIEKSPNGTQRAVLERLAESVRDGHRLSDAMRQQAQSFPPLFVGIVRAAEGTSDLPGALGRYIDYETRLQGVRHKVVSAAIYPAILLVVGSAVTLFLLGYVVPRFAAVYQGNGRTLPFASQLLMQWGAFVSAHAAALAIALGLAVTALGAVLMRNRRNAGYLALLGVFPGVRDRLAIAALSRLYLTLGTLLDGGIPLHSALRLCESVVASGLRERLASARASVEAGVPFSQALERAGLSTPVALRLVRVGEQSGQLGLMLTRAARFYDEEVARWIERFSRVFEPVLMAAIGLVVGVIVILLYMPIFDLAGSLQ